jgi:hydrogenase maturation protein HypF
MSRSIPGEPPKRPASFPEAGGSESVPSRAEERRRISVTGTVQGVGFRPFVFGLARQRHLRGFIKNQTGGVVIELEGSPGELDQFLEEMVQGAPSLAQIATVSSSSLPWHGDPDFLIKESDSERAENIFITPDLAACPECLAEMFDPGDRRHLYPFLNCTNCGPRLTIVTAAPYDRTRTTMASFALCSDCRREYEDPANRRFHAQPIACPRCGPRLRLLDGNGVEIQCNDPIRSFAEAIRAGKIGALKGLGGFHLACDATRAASVHWLRQRKERDEKPFALMVADLDAAEALCEIDPDERELLQSRRAPIVLLRLRKDGCSKAAALAREVAPGNPHLGLMLPYTPLHHLLFRHLPGIPLVMTSGNRSDEPIAFTNESALEQLRGIAGLFLVHDRSIQMRCDDSVTRMVAGIELPMRRSRGYAPEPVRLPFHSSASILAVGGQLKSTFALGRAEHAFLSHHLGDLDELEAFEAFQRDLRLYENLFQFKPEVVVHDLHPDYPSTRLAIEIAAGRQVRAFAVQHHHAHLASCLADNGLDEPVIGVIWDGAGLGSDGAIWGGEFLAGDCSGFHRAAHLRYVPMPGGEAAVRQPWRMGLAHLLDAGLEQPPGPWRVSREKLELVKKMIVRRFNTPITSSAGRLFDAVAALLGIRDGITYEGQAAMELEWLATETAPDGVYPFEMVELNPPQQWLIDTRPIIRAVVSDVENGISNGVVARRFHCTLVEMIAQTCSRIRQSTGLQSAALSGGVFMNALLLRESVDRLRKERFKVFRHRLVPPNDGGLSLGQLAVGARLVNQKEG